MEDDDRSTTTAARLIGTAALLVALVSGCGSSGSDAASSPSTKAGTSSDAPGATTTADPDEGGQGAGSGTLPDPCSAAPEDAIATATGIAVTDHVASPSTCTWMLEGNRTATVTVFAPGPINADGEPVSELDGAVYAGFAGLTWVGDQAKYVVTMTGPNSEEAQRKDQSIAIMQAIADGGG